MNTESKMIESYNHRRRREVEAENNRLKQSAKVDNIVMRGLFYACLFLVVVVMILIFTH